LEREGRREGGREGERERERERDFKFPILNKCRELY